MGAIPTEQSSYAGVAELRQQFDALVVRHAVMTIAMQEVLRSLDLPTARHLSRTIAARVALLMGCQRNVLMSPSCKVEVSPSWMSGDGDARSTGRWAANDECPGARALGGGPCSR